jgi:hypothetical protein
VEFPDFNPKRQPRTSVEMGLKIHQAMQQDKPCVFAAAWRDNVSANHGFERWEEV